MKKNLYKAFLAVAFLAAPMFLPGTKEASAGMRVDIHLGGPPMVVVGRAGPSAAVLPGRPLRFHDGCWYRLHQGRWFKAHSRGGPWVHVASGRVPRAFSSPPRHRRDQSAYRSWVAHRRVENARWKSERDRRRDHREERQNHGRRGGRDFGRGGH